MERISILVISIAVCIVQCQEKGETVLSAVLTPGQNLIRQERSYYERYGYGRPYDRLDDRPSRCGRCDDDDEDDDYDRGRDRDDDRRSNRPTQNNRYDRNNNDDNDRRYENDRNNANKNSTDDESDDKKRPHDDRNRDKHGGRRNKHRNRYDDRDRYSHDYYDRFLTDPYRDRYDRDRYYDDPYPRRPSYGRYPDRYDDYGGGYDRYGSGYRGPYYEDRYSRGGGYEDSFGGYGPGVGRGPHESFRPWDETYRGQAGWDAGGRGYYFASGRPDAGSWGQREYSRPIPSGGGWQNVGYSGYSNGNSGYSSGYPVYRGSGGYNDGYQDLNGYGQSSGWRSVGERRPYRDQSGVADLDKRKAQPQDNRYGQNQPGYSQIITYQPGTYSQGSTTPGTSYLFQREDEIVTQAETTVPPS